MKHLRIYVDTSVIGGCFDEEFAAATEALLERVRRGEVTLIISDLLARELSRAPESVQAVLDSLPDQSLERVEVTPEAESIRAEYLAAGVVGTKAKSDALHVAAATVTRADLVVSWNFRHIVNFERIRGYNAVNLRLGYPSIEIRSPREVVRHE